MKKIHLAGMIIALLSTSTLMGQTDFEGVNSEAELAVRVASRVKEIIASTEDRLAPQAPIVDTLALEEGLKEPRIIRLWMESEKAVKLTVTEPDNSGAMTRLSTFYFGGQDLFFASQPFARFIFIKGKLEYWLDEDWNIVPASPELLDEREELMYSEANRYLSWFFGSNE